MPIPNNMGLNRYVVVSQVRNTLQLQNILLTAIIINDMEKRFITWLMAKKAGYDSIPKNGNCRFGWVVGSWAFYLPVFICVL